MLFSLMAGPVYIPIDNTQTSSSSRLFQNVLAFSFNINSYTVAQMGLNSMQSSCLHLPSIIRCVSHVDHIPGFFIFTSHSHGMEQ